MKRLLRTLPCAMTTITVIIATMAATTTAVMMTIAMIMTSMVIVLTMLLVNDDENRCRLEPFAMGAVEFSWPRGAAKTWFTKPGFWEYFVGFVLSKQQNTEFSQFFEIDPGPMGSDYC